MNPRIIIAYKNFSRDCSISHMGLGVSAITTAKTLIQNGWRAEVWNIFDGADLWSKLNIEEEKCDAVTHVVISALFIPTAYLARLAMRFPQTQFAVNCHSNVGFLQAEPGAIRLIREAMDLEAGLPNFSAAGNSDRFCQWVRDAYSSPCSYLPNLYFLRGTEPVNRPPWQGGVLRLGCFGAARVPKNFATAVAAAIEIAYSLRAQTEIWMNSRRTDGNGNVVERAAREITRGLPNMELKYYDWAPWPQFRKFIGSMHLCLQPSFTESFNMVTADGIAEGVPSVVGEAITWVPDRWRADADNALDIASKGRALILDQYAARDGMRALRDYNQRGIYAWRDWLRPMGKEGDAG